LHVIFFDTESTNLAAAWGRVLCGSFAELQGDAYTFRADRKKWKGKSLIDDGALCVAIRDELESADMVCGWYSSLHDIPLINARLAAAGERPCRIGEKHGTWHLDLIWYSGGSSMKVGGKKLDLVAKFLGTEDSKTALDPQTWQLAGAGDKKGMDLVVEHCEADVLVLRELFPKLAPHVKKFTFSLSEVWPHLADIPSRISARR